MLNRPAAVATFSSRLGYHCRAEATKEIVMSQYRIAVIVGSLRKESFNKKLAHALIRLAPAEFRFEFSRI
ncbi:MAG TPA: NAD(P)H-dependent oxidoreductase, partial [Tahibacter sp.]|nr:NAD(P)H-dependent oxidoreductase [Tahibacter sp.]